MNARNFNPFKSKQEAMDRAKRTHLCLACGATQAQIWSSCPTCAAPEKGNRQLIMSKAELKRAGELILAQRLGQISQLRFQPRYALEVEGVKVTTYTADFEYLENGRTVVEDTKPMKFMDKYAKLKIDLFNAIHAKHNLAVLISRRG